MVKANSRKGFRGDIVRCQKRVTERGIAGKLRRFQGVNTGFQCFLDMLKRWEENSNKLERWEEVNPVSRGNTLKPCAKIIGRPPQRPGRVEKRHIALQGWKPEGSVDKGISTKCGWAKHLPKRDGGLSCGIWGGFAGLGHLRKKAASRRASEDTGILRRSILRASS